MQWQILAMRNLVVDKMIFFCVDVSEIRHTLQMSRKTFSEEFCFSLRTLEKWERGERVPEGPTRAYLMVIAENPMAVRNALKKTNHPG